MVGYVLYYIHINEIQDQQVNIVEYVSCLCRIHINEIQDQQVNIIEYVSCLCLCRVYVAFI